jgi:hypothetical protein
MMLHEQVDIITGANSAPLVYSAECVPLTAAETYELGRNVNAVTYRVILGPETMPLPAGAELMWRGQRYSAIGPAMQYTRRGAIHHYELLIARVGG